MKREKQKYYSGCIIDGGEFLVEYDTAKDAHNDARTNAIETGNETFVLKRVTGYNRTTKKKRYK